MLDKGREVSHLDHSEHDICTECGFGIPYFFTDEELAHTEEEGKIIEANIEAWRESYRKERAFPAYCLKEE